MSSVAGETVSRVTEAAKQAGSQAQDAASSLGAEADERARKFADRQLSASADIVFDVAEAFRSAADRLDRREPQIAQLARGAADKIEDFSDSVRGQSVEELWQASADFARRRPAVVFGATAGLGFLLFRLLRPGSPLTFGGGSTRRDLQWGQAGDDRLRSGRVPTGAVGGMSESPSGGGQSHGA